LKNWNNVDKWNNDISKFYKDQDFELSGSKVFEDSYEELKDIHSDDDDKEYKEFLNKFRKENRYVKRERENVKNSSIHFNQIETTIMKEGDQSGHSILNALNNTNGSQPYKHKKVKLDSQEKLNTHPTNGTALSPKVTKKDHPERKN
jgi:hypothetical protein